MKELEYPFDPQVLLSKKRQLRKELLADNTSRIPVKVAILGGYTTSGIRQMLELFLLHHGLRPSFYESEYNQFYQDALFENPELVSFAPDVIYLCTCNRNLTEYPSLSHSEEEIAAMVERETARYISIWEALRGTYHCPLIQNNMEMPLTRLLGNKDASDPHGAVSYLSRINAVFHSYAASHENFYICDIHYLSADYGLSKWSDPLYFHMYKYAVHPDAVPSLAFNVSNIIKSLYGKNKKGLVLDLDNTLWGGVVGDDGPENLLLGQEEPEGQAFQAFHRYLKSFEPLGVLLAVNSKNEQENALAGLSHPDSLLRPEDFVLIKANWSPKDRNFAEIADELSLLPESLVFVDDNPAERHIVTSAFPGVSAPELGDPAHFPLLLDRSGFFEVTSLSGDDLKRTEMYRENARRKQLESTYTDYHEYLESLDMKAVIAPFEPLYMARIAQLTNKSNQFNLTTRRYTQTEIEEIASDESYVTLYGKLTDRFGDNGVVSVVIGRLEEETCHVDLWLMSCRVLKRDMEFAMMDALAARCQSRGIRLIRGYYYPTAKNAMVKDFYALQGFEKLSQSDDGSSVWQLEIPENYRPKQDVIQIESAP